LLSLDAENVRRWHDRGMKERDDLADKDAAEPDPCNRDPARPRGDDRGPKPGTVEEPRTI